MQKRHVLILIVLAVTVIISFLWNIKMSTSLFIRYKNMPIRIDYSGDHYPYPTTTNISVFVSKQLNFSINDFYSTDLVEYPEEANKLSVLLTNALDVINEAQRIHMNIFKSLLGKYKYAMLLDYATSENKGDSAIGVGEFILLHKLKLELVYACAAFSCKIRKAQNISKQYANTELVILFQGGGNIGLLTADKQRAVKIQLFSEFHIIVFPQSIFYHDLQSHIEFCKTMYSSHKRLTLVWRDKESYKFGKRLFPTVQSLLSPDMAYQIGYVPRYMLPTQDILWLKRTDKASIHEMIPSAESGYRMHVSDWVKWKTPEGTSRMENVFIMTANGMTFLQRGRVCITDRLHGHILSTLLDIPHVYIDNYERKVSTYHNTWTASLENIVLANSSADALVQAKILLNKLNKHLPPIKGV